MTQRQLSKIDKAYVTIVCTIALFGTLVSGTAPYINA